MLKEPAGETAWATTARLYLDWPDSVYKRADVYFAGEVFYARFCHNRRDCDCGVRADRIRSTGRALHQSDHYAAERCRSARGRTQTLGQQNGHILPIGAEYGAPPGTDGGDSFSILAVGK